jgi:uncharacterized protein YfaQ (DUF2300 family)
MLSLLLEWSPQRERDYAAQEGSGQAAACVHSDTSLDLRRATLYTQDGRHLGAELRQESAARRRSFELAFDGRSAPERERR